MAYVAPIHRPSSIRHALKLRFLDSDTEALVVAKVNRLEIYEQTATGLELRHTRGIYGKVTMLESLRPEGATTDHLFVGSDRYHYFTVSWDPTTKSLNTERTFIDLADKTGRDSQAADRCAWDPTHRLLMLELFEGILTLIPTITQAPRTKDGPGLGSLGDPLAIRIPEFQLRSWTFLRPRKTGNREKPRLAVLFEDNQEVVRFRIKLLNYTAGIGSEPGSAEFDDDAITQRIVDPSASHLIPVLAPTYGVIILAEPSISYVADDEAETIHQHPLPEPTIFVAWAAIDDHRWLIGDDYGSLYMLMLVTGGGRSGNAVTGIRFEKLGTASRASVLSYLSGDRFFLGSHQSDSQVIRIGQGHIEVLQTIANIAPILDFTIMDLGNRSGGGLTNEYSSGQARIVSGSGAFQDGSLRSIRSGVGIEQIGDLGEMPNVTDLFALRTRPGSRNYDTLIVSFVEETRAFRFGPADEGDEVDELDANSGLQLNASTVLAKNTSKPCLILQCTPASARLIDTESGMTQDEWRAESSSIVAAATNRDKLLLSLEGTDLVSFDLGQSSFHEVVRRKQAPDQQVSCIEVPATVPHIAIIGFWSTAEVAVVRLEDLEQIVRVKISDDAAAIPRSILLVPVLAEESPTLFVALADGNVVTYDWDISTLSLSGRKSTILGTEEARLTALPRIADDETAQSSDLYTVFATSEHPSLIYGSEGRLVFSAVTLGKAVCVCPFSSPTTPGAIAIATTDNLQLAAIDRERITHIQSLHVSETVRRIAYAPQQKAFGMGTIARSLRQGAEIVQSHFKLVDEVVLQELDTFTLNEEELVESVICADLHAGGGELVERFVVGTAYIADAEPDAIRGRILVFDVTEDRKLQVVTELATKGACRALGALQGRIVAALIKTVIVYAFEAGELVKTAAYRTATAPIDLAVTGDIVAVADLMKSLSVLRFTPGAAGLPDRLIEIARHYETLWSTAIAALPSINGAAGAAQSKAILSWLEGDAEGNLILLRHNDANHDANDRRRLEITAEMQLGEMVNRMRPVAAPASRDAVVIPRAFLGTVEGGIYLFGLINDNYQDLLMRLQTRLADCVRSPGHTPFTAYRAFRNTVRTADEPFRFVDGELIDKFLDCDPALQQEIVAGLGNSINSALQSGKDGNDRGGNLNNSNGTAMSDFERVRGIVETLRRLL